MYSGKALNSLKKGKRERLEALFSGRFVPRSLYFDSTNVCNANCVFCGYVPGRTKGTFLPKEVFAKAVEQYMDMGGTSIALTPIVGDPLLDKEFHWKLRHWESVPGIRTVRFFTNAIGLTPAVAEPFFSETEKEMLMFVSVLGFDRETFARIARVDRFEIFQKNMLHFLDRLEGEGKGSIKLVCMPRCHGRDDGTQLFGRLAPYMFPDNVKSDGSVFPPRFDSFAGHSETGLVENAGLQLMDFMEKDGPCDILFTKPIILADGTVNACAERDMKHELAIGNIHEQPLKAIFRGKRFLELVSRFHSRETVPECCRACSTYRSVYDENAKIWNNIMSWRNDG